eukprot:11226135-Lingulodinium_polyedra.AAC.1
MGFHGHARANNLLVKPPGAGCAATFLAALDFDMALSRVSYLHVAVLDDAGLAWIAVVSPSVSRRRWA